MPEIGTSGSMSGDGKRSVGHRPQATALILDSTRLTADLGDKLAAVGIKDNERNISNKIGRGTFTAVFFIQRMEAIGCRTIHLEGD